MSKRPDTTETVILAIEILRRIPRGRKITASELHAQLQSAGITREIRTIQRQLEMLSEHFEIERDDRNKPYGYSWLAHAQGLALTSMTPQESLLLGLAEEHLKRLLPARLMKSMASFFTQAKGNLAPNSNAKLEREWASKVRVVATSQPLLPPTIKQNVFDAVSEALYVNNWLQVTYVNANGKRSKSEVMPLGLAQQGPRLYLVCRYPSYDGERSLALHRIESAEVSMNTFERPKDFDLKQYDDDGQFGYGDGKRIRLKFCIKKAAGYHLTESQLSTDQQVKALDDAYEITATVVDSEMLNWWLQSFGDAVTNVKRSPVAKQMTAKES
jgi:predicted DNA-binding transcriptional regulator YafY